MVGIGVIWYCKVEIFIYYDNMKRRIHLFFNIIQKYIITTNENWKLNNIIYKIYIKYINTYRSRTRIFISTNIKNTYITYKNRYKKGSIKRGRI